MISEVGDIAGETRGCIVGIYIGQQKKEGEEEDGSDHLQLFIEVFQ